MRTEALSPRVIDPGCKQRALHELFNLMNTTQEGRITSPTPIAQERQAWQEAEPTQGHIVVSSRMAHYSLFQKCNSSNYLTLTLVVLVPPPVTATFVQSQVNFLDDS